MDTLNALSLLVRKNVEQIFSLIRIYFIFLTIVKKKSQDRNFKLITARVKKKPEQQQKNNICINKLNS